MDGGDIGYHHLYQLRNEAQRQSTKLPKLWSKNATDEFMEQCKAIAKETGDDQFFTKKELAHRYNGGKKVEW